jgi:hypothetical protein
LILCPAGYLLARRLASRKRWLSAPKERTVSTDAGQRGISAASQCRRLIMTTRSRRETVTFKHAFRIRGIDRLLSVQRIDASAFHASAFHE